MIIMKKYIYILLAFCLLISCMENPTAGMVVPKYTPSTEGPGGPNEEPGDGLIDPAEPLDRRFMHLEGRELRPLNSIFITGLDDGERVIFSTSAGLAVRVTGDQVYISEGDPSSVWSKRTQNRYGTPTNTYNTLAPLIQHYVETGAIRGYIVYTPYSEGQSYLINVATPLCGLLRGVAIPESLVDKVKAMGATTELMDVRPRDEKWLHESCKDRLDKSLAVDTEPETFHYLHGYITATSASASYDCNAYRNWSWRTSILKDLDKGAYCPGYYDLDKWGMVNDASQPGVSMLPTDQAANPATLSSIYDTTGLK